MEALKTDVRRELNRREKALVAQAPTLVQASLDSHLASLRQGIWKLQRAIDEHIDHHVGSTSG